MSWKTLLAYITGTVDQQLLWGNEYLVTENRILRNQIKGRIQLSESERKALADIGQKLGKQALQGGLLSPGQYLIHDRNTKFCAAFQQIIDDASVERVVLPPGHRI